LYLLTRLQDFSFSIAGTVVTFAVGGRRALQRLFDRLVSRQISTWWYAAALLPVLWYLIAIGMAELSSGDVLSSLTLTPTALRTMLVSAESGLLVTLFLRGPMGEELGLRGFALVHLQQRFTAFRAAFLLGIVWAIWHLPVLVGCNPVEAVIFLLLALNLSFLFAWLFNRSHGLLIPVLIMHATQNNEELFEVIFPALVGTNRELPSTLLLLVTGIAAGVALWRQGRQAVADADSLVTRNDVVGVNCRDYTKL